MLFLASFDFPDAAQEECTLRAKRKMTCYSTYYPFDILPAKELESLEFEPITILYGSNGCGKTTVLNIICETLRLSRDAPYNCSEFFSTYINMCDYDMLRRPTEGGRFISSDDVFDYMLNLRRINTTLDDRRTEMFKQYEDDRESGFRLRSLDDAETLRRVNLARANTRSQYINSRMSKNMAEHSNGESAFLYFREKIRDNTIYLLDEPENSLSPGKQLELLQFLEESARFYNCQFIIATHSPFFLAMKGAKIYDMDSTPVVPRKWTELENVRIYYDFFRKHQHEFE